MICIMLMRSALRQQKDCLTSQNKLEIKEEDINMKSYNIQNYIRYKQDLEQSLKRIPKKEYKDYKNEVSMLFPRFTPYKKNN